MKFVFGYTGTVTPKPKNKDDVPVPYVGTFYVVATDTEDALNILQISNPKVPDFVYTGYCKQCNKDWG